MNSHGFFEVSDLCFPSAPIHLLPSSLSSKPLTIALLSGLNLGTSQKTLETQLAFDYLSGLVGGQDV